LIDFFCGILIGFLVGWNDPVIFEVILENADFHEEEWQFIQLYC
jgi:hypothetical protein